MKLIISSAELSSHLQAISRVISSKNSYPILDCILFEVKEGKLYMTASDSETTIDTWVDVIESDGDAKFAIVAKNIQEAIKEIPEQPLTFNINQSNNSIEIKYQNGTYNLVGMDADTYPTPIEMGDGTGSVVIPAKTMFSSISRCLFAIGNDELRKVMNGVYFDIAPEETTFVASDGHKLVRCKSTAAKGNEKAAFIIPQKPAGSLKSLLAKEEDDVVIKFNDRNAVFTLASGTKLTCRFIDGRYPNYNSVIPSDNPFKLTIDRQQLLSALRRVLVFSSQSSALIKFSASTNNLTISGQDIDFSTSAEESITCDYTSEPLNIGFKGSFLCDILNNISSENVTIALADPSRAGVITPTEQEENEDTLMILMPMMLND